jgi:DNA-directed RNA polymerase subunit RPC12/RpoP
MVENTDKCVECGESTAFGSGRFVNRIPADEGWLCPDCLAEVCETCGDDVLEYTGKNGFIQCDPCADDWGQRESRPTR